MEVLLKIPNFKGVVVSKNPAPQEPQKIPSSGETVKAPTPVLAGTFQIKDGLQQLSDQKQDKPIVIEVAQEQVAAHDLFSQEQVKASLKAYVLQHQPDTMVELALETHQPSIEHDQITIWVDNQLQIEKLEAIKAHLSGFLMKQMNNGAIVLNIQLFDANETKEKKKFYTATEKFDHFVQLNPVIAELKQLFGLELN